MQDHTGDENRKLTSPFRNRVTMRDLAQALHPDRELHVATVRAWLDRLRVPYSRVGNERFYDPAAVVAAIAADEERNFPPTTARGQPPPVA